MHSRHLWASATLLTTALAVSALLVIDPTPWHQTTALLLVSGLLSWAAIAIVAILIENSRLGYRLGLLVLTISGVIALIHPISPTWWATIAVLAAAALLFADPALGGWVRRTTPATPVPTRAVFVALLLLTLPGLTALLLADPPGWLTILSLVDYFLLFVYVRRFPFALLAIRTLPAVLTVFALTIPAPGRFLWIAGQLVALGLAWTKDVRLAVRPLIERGSRLMIPPELAPEEIRQMLEGNR